MSTELKTAQTDPFALALPVTVVKHPNAGKVILEDDNGEWLCDVHSRKAYSLAAALNDLPRLRSLADAGEKVAEALESCITALTDPRNGEWPWVENGHMHEHFRDVSESAKSALTAYHAAKSQSEPTNV